MKLKYLIIAITLFHGLQRASDRLRIDPLAVERARTDIERELNYTSIARAGVITSAALATTFVLYKVALSYFGSDPAPFSQDFEPYPHIGTSQWIMRIGKMSRDLFLSGMMTRVAFSWGESLLASLFHKRDIAWYIQTHTSLSYIFSELRALSQTVVENNCCDKHDESWQQSIDRMMHSCIQHVEKLLGFIHYCARSKASQFKPIMQIAHHIELSVNHVIEKYEKAHESADYRDFLRELTVCETELTRACARCAHIREDKTWIQG